MDVQIQTEGGINTFSSGDHISGSIQISCAHTMTITKLSATLIGQSISCLTGAPGLLFSRREEETHVFLREEFRLVPSLLPSKPQDSRSVRLDPGSHTFDFQLRVPWVQDCSSCPPNTPNEDEYDCDSAGYMSLSTPQLPPSTTELQEGNKVTYKIDVVVTTIRNMFKSRTVKV